jgi:excisionase family DNA binding protein
VAKSSGHKESIMSEQQNNSWMPEPALWTIEQAAAFLNVSVRTVKRLISIRELVARRIGSRVLIPKTSLEAFLRKDHATTKV